MIDPDYSLATNKAYDLLIRFPDFSFPIPIFSLIRAFPGNRLLPYSEASKKFNIPFDDFCKEVSSDYGFTIKDKNSSKNLIIYNDLKDETIVRFTLAHELGHYVLHHTNDDDISNKEANCFARNLLCPIPVIDALQLSSVREYTDTFWISEPAATVAIEFKDADLRNITPNRYNIVTNKAMCFYNGVSYMQLYGY